MNAEEIGSKIQEILSREILEGEAATALDANTPLLTSGVMDSLATMNLVGYLEDEYGIAIAAHEINNEHFNQLSDIVALVMSKRA